MGRLDRSSGIRREWDRLVRAAILVFRKTGLSLTTWLVLFTAVSSTTRLQDASAVYFQSDRERLLHLAQTLPALVALCVLLQHLVPAKRWIAFAVNAGFITLYSLLAHVHAEHKVSLDYSIVAQYAGQTLRFGTREFLLHSLPASLIALVGGLAIVEIATQQISTTVRARRRLAGAALSAALYAFLTFGTPLAPQDEYSSLLRGSVDFHLGRADWKEAPGTPRYPYALAAIPAIEAGAGAGGPRRPHVFIVLLESFNAGFAEYSSPEGKEVTPFFNSKIAEGVYVQDFYGNSVQSIQGYFALLTSVLPSFRGRIATDYARLHLRGLPKILAESGYQTQFWSGFTDLLFDNVGELMTGLGMKRVRAMEKSTARKEDLPHYWGWGLQDDVFYRRFFEDLDRQQSEQTALVGEAPRFFSVLAATSHHDPFDLMPEGLRQLYPEPRGRREEYMNSLHLLDGYLREFFLQLERRPYLKDSLLVLVGDHGFPVGEHGLYHNESAFHEEFFRTPLLLIWRDQLRPRRIERPTFSQLDVAPTILGLLGIRTRNHFTGRNIFELAEGSERSVQLVQPYGGTYLATVLSPFKYVRHLATERRYLFDLAEDPSESKNLAEDPASGEALRRMQDLQGSIYFNQKLLQEDRIWPADPRSLHQFDQ